MSRCEKCYQHGIPALCENDDKGPNQRTCYTGRNTSVVLEGKIVDCPIKPLLPTLAKMLKPPSYVHSRQQCSNVDNCTWVKAAMRSWRSN